IRRAGVGRPGLVELIDLQHQLDRRDAANGIRREHAEPQRDRPDELAVDIHRTAAHSAGHVRALRLAAHLPDNDVLLRTPGVFPQSDDLDRDRFRLAAGEYGPGGGVHAGLQVDGLHDLDWAGFRWTG